MPAPKENQHAAKNKGYDDRLNVETVKANKEAWKLRAKSEDKTFTDWVNEACKDKHSKGDK